MRAILIWLFTATLTWAEGERAGAFDYYVLALSWSPNWCALEGDARGADQCDVRHDHGWILHGLWPQYDRGWPSYCPTHHTPPSRAMTARMADIMGSTALTRHQWKKHGTCSGLAAADYFARSRAAYERITRPAVFRDLNRAVELPAAMVEEAFRKDNPGLAADGITITCKAGYIQEVRLCLDRSLAPIACASDVARDCNLRDAKFTPVR